MRREAIISILLTVLTFAVYASVGNHGFLSFDDNLYVTENPAVTGGLTGDAVAAAFSFSRSNYWHPLTTMSHALDVSLFGLVPGPQHLVNVLFHVYAVLLLFIFFRLATGTVWPSALVAALFALHPVNVESVAWLAERKSVLSGFFFMGGLVCYALYVRKKGLPLYLAVFFCMLAGILTKPSVVTFPLILLVADWWPLQRLADGGEKGGLADLEPLVREKIPLLFLSLFSVFISAFSMSWFKNVPGTESMGLRAENAVVSLFRYLGELAWPVNLAAFYPFPRHVPAAAVAASALGICAITAGVFWVRKKRPYLLFGWAWFLIAVSPMLGLIQGGLWPSMADRFLYLPAVGIFAALAFGLNDAAKSRPAAAKGIFGAAVAAVLLLSALTYRQVSFWKDDFTLFSHAAEVTDGNFVAYNNIGFDYSRKGDLDSAETFFRKAIAANPEDAFALRNLADVGLKKGDANLAAQLYDQSIALNPGDPVTYKKYAKALVGLKDYEGALAQLEKAEGLAPYDPEVYNNMGIVRIYQSDAVLARAMFEKALSVAPGYRLARENLEKLSTPGALPQAGGEQTPQDDARTHYQAALLLDQKGDRKAAAAEYEAALLLSPGMADAANNLGLFYLSEKNLPKAREYFLRALSADAKSVAALYNMACLESVSGNPDEAVRRLGQAADAGFSDRALAETDPDLAPVRELPAFTTLMGRLPKADGPKQSEPAK
ncbi:MAG: tetratricopeptide repeat protein [Thermodesulfobacteriota bacterium]